MKIRYSGAEYNTVQWRIAEQPSHNASHCNTIPIQYRGQHIVQYSTVQYSTVLYSTVQCSIVQHSTVQYSAVQYSTVQYSTVQCSTVQYLTVFLKVFSCIRVLCTLHTLS